MPFEAQLAVKGQGDRVLVHHFQMKRSHVERAGGVFEESHGMQSRLGRRGHAADEALMEVAEEFATQSGRTARDSVDLDVGAETNSFEGRVSPICPPARIGIPSLHAQTPAKESLLVGYSYHAYCDHRRIDSLW